MSSPNLLADYSPGSLTAFFSLALGGIAVVTCFVGAAISRFAGYPETSRLWLKAAGLFFILAVGWVILEMTFARETGML